MEPEFVEGDRATRFKLLAFVGVATVLILVDLLTSPDAALHATDPLQALKKSADRLLIFALTAFPLCVGASIYVLRLGIKVKSSGQYPPPGLRPAVRTRVRRGRRAKWNALLMFGLAGILMVAGPALICTWYSISRLATELSHPNKKMQPAPRNGRS